MIEHECKAKPIKTIKEYVFTFCENGATKASMEKIILDGKECWTMTFKDENENIYGAFNIEKLRASELKALLDAIDKKKLPTSINPTM